MTLTSPTRTARGRGLATAALGAAALLALSGCGSGSGPAAGEGSSIDGTYYSSDGSANKVKKLVIDGNQATYTVDLCKGPDDGATSHGELNDVEAEHQKYCDEQFS